jgi:nitrite reductase/ring-hydroxylating ferredoxin subunit
VSAEQSAPAGPDLKKGIAIESIPDGGMIGGHADGQAVVLARDGQEIFAVGGQCTHYGAPLADGLVVGHTLRCPWHHACFDLRTGEALAAPALNPLSRWEVVREGATVRVVNEIPAADGATPIRARAATQNDPQSIVIVGAGAAGNAAAEMLRREGYTGKVTMIGGDESVPYDRPNLSKDYLAGNAPEEWIPLRPDEFYAQHEIELIRGVTVSSIDASARSVALSNGESRSFD